MKSHRFLPLLFLIPCLALAGNGEKKFTATTPPAPMDGYFQGTALEDLSKLPSAEAFSRLHLWLLNQCFGGAQPDFTAFRQPRVAQALWLAVVTDALGRKTLGAEEAAAHLGLLLEQKALDTATGTFFRNLWSNLSLSTELRDQRAADFLRAWLASWKTPAPDEAETMAISQAVKAGVGSLDFFPETTPAAPQEKN